MQNQNPTTPPAQVPDDRFNQVMARMRELEQQNAQLRGQVDFMAKQSQPAQPRAEQQLFKPEVDQAITQKFQSLLEPVQQQFNQAVGMMMDRTDRAEFELRFRNSNYAKILPQVEEEAERLKRSGQWVPREQILQKVWFDETGKKAQEPPPQTNQAPGPQYDPYTGRWTESAVPQGTTGQPASQQIPQQVAQAAPQQAPVAQQPPQQTPGYPSQQQWPPQNASQWVPNLPQAEPPPQAPVAQATVQPTTGLSLDTMNFADRDQAKAADQRLERWASQYGDIPL